MQQRAFEFNGHPVRVVMVEQGLRRLPYFIGRDIADLLGYRDTEAMTRKLGGEGFILRSVQGVGTRDVILLDEYGLNLSVFGAKKEDAPAIRRWVQDVLLPSVKGAVCPRCGVSA